MAERRKRPHRRPIRARRIETPSGHDVGVDDATRDGEKVAAADAAGVAPATATDDDDDDDAAAAAESLDAALEASVGGCVSWVSTV